MDRRSGSRLRWLGALAVALVALAAVATSAASPSTVTYTSNFEVGNENWWSNDLTNFNPATWQSSGGNPNGYITAVFPGGGGLMQSVPTGAGSTWPAANARGDYGGTIGADVRVNLTGLSGTESLTLGFFSTNSYTIACANPVTPTASWASYAVTLDTSHLFDCISGKPLTGAQAVAALAGFDGMFVDAENNDNVGETVSVDNAMLAPPAVAVAPPTGNVTRTLSLSYKARKLSGSLTAGDDLSCAAKTKVTIYGKVKKKQVKVGTATTGAPSDFLPGAPALFTLKLKKSVKGKLYASVAKSTSKLDGNVCVAAKSKRVTVR